MKELLLQLIDGRIPITLDIAIVKELKGDTCHVESIHTGKDFFNCRINALESNGKDYLKVTPSVGSSVVIGVFKDSEKAILLATSEVDEIEFYKNTTKLKLSGEGLEIERNETTFKDLLNDVSTEMKNIVIEVAKAQTALGLPPSGTAKITNNIDLKINTAINQIFN